MNKGYALLSALLKGVWLIDPEWVNNNYVLIERVLGEKMSQEDMKAAGLLASEDPLKDSKVYSVQNGVAVINIEGALTKNGGLCGYGTADYMQLLQHAYNDDSIRGIVLFNDSPGGQVAGIDAFYRVMALRNKPVVSVIDDQSASANYWMICNSDHIFISSSTTVVGSIGVAYTQQDFSKQLEARGIVSKTFYSLLSPQKNIEGRELAKGNEKPLMDQLEQIALVFHGAVIDGRGAKLQRAKGNDPLDGGVYIGQAGIDSGLADGFGTLHDGIEMVLSLSKNPDKTLIFNANSDSKMFNKFPNLTALKGLEPSAITEEMIDGVNAELVGRGVTGAVVINADWVEKAENLQATNDQLTQEVADLKAKGEPKVNAEQTQKVADLEAKVSQLTGDLTTANANHKAVSDEFTAWKAKTPAGETAKPLKKDGKETIEGSGAVNEFLSHADEELERRRAAAQFPVTE